jgi:hypothetical protein
MAPLYFGVAKVNIFLKLQRKNTGIEIFLLRVGLLCFAAGYSINSIDF